MTDTEVLPQRAVAVLRYKNTTQVLIPQSDGRFRVGLWEHGVLTPFDGLGTWSALMRRIAEGRSILGVIASPDQILHPDLRAAYDVACAQEAAREARYEQAQAEKRAMEVLHEQEIEAARARFDQPSPTIRGEFAPLMDYNGSRSRRVNVAAYLCGTTFAIHAPPPVKNAAIRGGWAISLCATGERICVTRTLDAARRVVGRMMRVLRDEHLLFRLEKPLHAAEDRVMFQKILGEVVQDAILAGLVPSLTRAAPRGTPLRGAPGIEDDPQSSGHGPH
ncbi:MAG: hypothetical protein M0Z85_07580 [Gammaproteobacteria bacterium]|nr:hypothetical protein [Gammaproteobacteria bacterium]